MASSRIHCSLSNFAEFAEALKRIPEPVAREVLPRAMGAAVKPIEAAARAMAPRRTGALRRSITSAVRIYKGTKAVGIVGPDRDYYASGKRVKGGESRQGADRPANYAHLVEFGHASAGGGSVAAQPFMRPAVATSEAQVVTAFADALATGIDTETGKQLQRLKRGRK